MNIRQARNDDIESIIAIAESLVVRLDSMAESGLAGYRVPPEELWKAKIKDNPLFYVAEDITVVGYLVALSDEKMRLSESNDKIHLYMLDKKEPLIYIDCLGVREDYQKQGIALMLWDKLELGVKASGIINMWGAIAHAPFRNKGSIEFHTARGGNFVEEYDAWEIRFGIYRKSMSNT